MKLIFAALFQAILVIPAITTAYAAVLTEQATCANPVVRKEWRTLGADEQAEYIRAVKCLAEQPSQLPAGTNSTRLYDNFPEVHATLNEQVHNNAYFLPWHRYFVHLYEKALIESCGYTGHAVYWDWTLDMPAFAASPVWADSSFGGNGTDNSSCVTTGPFANFTVYIREPHCLQRNLAGTLPDTYGNDFAYNHTVDALLASANTYSDFEFRFEGTAHSIIHFSVGGDMIPEWSPNDPIFFLHHGNIDRIWWLWQQRAKKHLLDFEGNADGDGNVQAHITDSLPMFGFAPEVQVADVMLTEGGLNGALCYTY